MSKKILLALSIGITLGVLFVAKNCAAAPADSDTETVIATHRVKRGMENDYLKLLDQQWSTLRKLGLVLDKPHLLMRGQDEPGKTYFVEILTWTDHDAADHVPPEVQAIWNKMNASTEARGGHSAIEFPEVHVVELGKPSTD